MARRPWTASESDYLRGTAGKLTAAQVARSLGRSESGVHQQRRRLGLGHTQRGRGPGFDAYVREKHAAGWSDAEVAAGRECDRTTVRNARRRLGLKANGWNDRQRRRMGRRLAEQLRREGLTSAGQIRSRAFRRRAAEQGWPDDLSPREVAILNGLWERGPMTRREIADAIGMEWHGSRASLKCRGGRGSYLANLVRRGLVVCLGKQNRVVGKGRGHSTCVYSLALWVERNAG